MSEALIDNDDRAVKALSLTMVLHRSNKGLTKILYKGLTKAGISARSEDSNRSD